MTLSGSECKARRGLDFRLPLWLGDSIPIQSPAQGPSFAFTQLNGLYNQVGYNASPVANQWNNGVAPAHTGQSRRSGCAQ